LVECVPGVKDMVYRRTNKRILEFVKTAYSSGIQAFEGTPVHEHLLWLLRLIVHHGYERKPGASKHLRDVAEAFTDCQAVQARVIERTGLEIRGVSADFCGLVKRLVGEYKTMTIKMLAYERIGQRIASDGTHYENRLTQDIGDALGLNQDDIRRAMLDEHAMRFPRLSREEQLSAAARCRELFDVEALVKALMAEVSSFGLKSSAASLPLQFLNWASERLRQKYIVFTDDSATDIRISEGFALAVIEALFLGQPSAPPEEMYRGVCLLDLFLPSGDIVQSSNRAVEAKCHV